MIFALSREVYGSDCSKEAPCNEDSLPNPVNLYGRTKWEGEQEIHLKSSDGILRKYLVLRLASVYGGLYDIPERLIPSLTIKAMMNGQIILNGGGHFFDFVHIEDVVSSFESAVERLSRINIHKPAPSGGNMNTFVICSGRSTSATEILRHVQDHSQSQHHGSCPQICHIRQNFSAKTRRWNPYASAAPDIC